MFCLKMFEETKRCVKGWINHKFNPLHVYCKLRHKGYSQSEAIQLAVNWDRIYRHLPFIHK
jgi:hypothetical protein